MSKAGKKENGQDRERRRERKEGQSHGFISSEFSFVFFNRLASLGEVPSV